MKNKIDYVPGQFDEEEKLALEQFEKFASYFPKIYTSWTGMASGSRVDVMSENITGGCASVELKKRSEDAERFGDLFIEPDKYNALKNIWEDRGYFPIYINFIGDYKNVYVYYIAEVERYSLHRNMLIRHQNGEYSREDRYGLYWEDAHHFIYNEETDSYNEIKPKNIKPNEKKAAKLHS
jgi:hypothetical protein